MTFDVSTLQQYLTKDKFMYIQAFLSKCPPSILQSMELCFFKERDILMYTGDTNRDVYISLKGSVDGSEEKSSQLPYTFTVLEATDVIGGYELFSKSNYRYVTIRIAKTSICLKLNSLAYLHWMKNDSNALFLRMQLLMQVLSLETQYHRQYLFLDNETRVVLYLMSELQEKAKRFPFTIRTDREQIASRIGCSVRTLNRVVSTLEEKEMIQRHLGKIISSKQKQISLKRFIRESEVEIKLTLPKI